MDDRTSVQPESKGSGQPAAGLRLRHLLLVTPLVVVIAYAMCVLGWVAPPSKVKSAAQPELDAVMLPYFVQTWTLFAPNPVHANVEGWYQVGYRVDGRPRTSQVYSLTKPYRQAARRIPLVQGRTDRIVSSVARDMGLIRARQRPRKDQSGDQLDVSLYAHGVATSPADQGWNADLRTLQQVTSPLADSLRLPGQVTSLRVFFTQTLTNGADGSAGGAPMRVADTGWIPYLSRERR